MSRGGRIFKDPNHVHVAQVLVSKPFERCQEVDLQLGFGDVILRREQKFPSKAGRFFRNFYCRLSKDFRRIGGDSSAWNVKNYPTLGCTRKAEEGSSVIVATQTLARTSVARPRRRYRLTGSLDRHERRDAVAMTLRFLLALDLNPRQISQVLADLPDSERQIYRRCEEVADLVLDVDPSKLFDFVGD